MDCCCIICRIVVVSSFSMASISLPHSSYNNRQLLRNMIYSINTDDYNYVIAFVFDNYCEFIILHRYINHHYIHINITMKLLCSIIVGLHVPCLKLVINYQATIHSYVHSVYNLSLFLHSALTMDTLALQLYTSNPIAYLLCVCYMLTIYTIVI